MKFNCFSLIAGKYPGFEYRESIEPSELRHSLFVLITDDIESFFNKYSAILPKTKGIIIVPGESFSFEKPYENIRIIRFTPDVEPALLPLAEILVSIFMDNIKLASAYELLKIESGRTQVQYNRLLGFYESVQEKARHDIRHQNKWTIEALLKLIKFRNDELLKSSLEDYPETVISFFRDNYFDFKGVAILKNYDTTPEIIISTGDVKEALHEKNGNKGEAGWVSVFPLTFENRPKHLLIALKNKKEYLKEYETSFFLLFSEIAVSTYREKLNEHTLIEAKDEAEKANRLKSQFMANINHELRNPLNGIMGMIGLLKMSELDSIQKQQVSLLEFSAQSLGRIINDLLDFSSIEKGNFRLNRETFLADELLKKTVSLFDIPAQNKGLKLKLVNNYTANQQLEGDPNRLQQIIINFITNSIKYSEHGEITLRLDVDEEDRNGIILRFSVSDTGIGIPEEKMDSIFTEFVQLEDTYTKSRQGLGLGLAIVKELTRNMNGKIEVESTPGKGSTFSVIIPFKKSLHESNITEIKHEKKAAARKLRIMIAEDDVINMFYLEMTFMEMGHSIDKAKNGHDALELILSNTYDILFMDIGMPEMNGMECIKIIRKNKITTPAVVISGYTSENEIQKFMSAGFNRVLSKPVDINNLKEVIDSLL